MDPDPPLPPAAPGAIVGLTAPRDFGYTPSILTEKVAADGSNLDSPPPSLPEGVERPRSTDPSRSHGNTDVRGRRGERRAKDGPAPAPSRIPSGCFPVLILAV